MAKTLVLDRVASDLARGLTHPAIQRLSSLVASHPHDLDLRRRLAAVHRRVGNQIQAGRWDYLTIGADSNDTTAFERAFPSALARLREVRWPHRANQAATAYARTRLAKLVAAAEAERPVSPHRNGAVTPLRARGQWQHFGRSWSFPTIPLAVAVLATAPLILVGLVTVVQWIVQ